MALLNRDYLLKKANGFIKYCVKNRYLRPPVSGGKSGLFHLDIESVLGSYSDREYRKRNPIGFHANELLSLGEAGILNLFDAHLDAQ